VTLANHTAVGKRLRELGIDLKPGARQLVAVTKAGCDPCEKLKLFLCAHPEIHVRYVDVQSLADAHKYVPLATPTILYVREDGTVEDEGDGWSPDVRWQEAFLMGSTKFLNSRTGAATHRENTHF
jgi:hypothetical protein